MARAVSAAGFCVVAATALLALELCACGQSAVSAPQAPSREVETRILPPRHPHEIPRLIAPPPAYGNKIVLAHAGDQTSVN